jgi:hypothetical protein
MPRRCSKEGYQALTSIWAEVVNGGRYEPPDVESGLDKFWVVPQGPYNP